MGILTIIFSVLGSIGSAIGAFLKVIPPIGWLCIVCIAIGFCWGGKGCHFSIFPKHEPRITAQSFDVVRVINGVTIETKCGVLNKRKQILQLTYIVCPSYGTFVEQARRNLELSCGNKIYFKDGVYRGASGINLSIDQLEHGFAWCASGAPKEYLKAEKEAKKYKRGIWGAK